MIPTSTAGKLQMIIELMGGQEAEDEEGNTYITPSLITKDEALKLLNMQDGGDE